MEEMKWQISFNYTPQKISVRTLNNLLILKIWNTVGIVVYLLCNKK